MAVLNYLPPSIVDIPSISLSSIQKIMTINNVPSKIIYWNILFNQILEDFPGEKHIYEILLPFFYMDYLNHNLDVSNFEILLDSLSPTNKIEGFYKSHEFYIEKIKLIENLIEKQLKAHCNDNIWAYSIKHNQWVVGNLLAERIKKNDSNKVIIAGGFDTKYAAKEYLEKFSFCDYALWGENEKNIIPLIQYISDGKQNIKNEFFNIASKGSNGTIEFYESNCLRNNLSKNILSFHDFFSTYNNSKDKTIIPIEGSRGCDWNKCHFCTINTPYYNKLKNINDIIEEINSYYSNYGNKKFLFTDSDIIQNDYSRFSKLLDLLIKYRNKKNESFDFFAEIIPYNLDKSIIYKIKKAGFESVQIGLEALSDSLLKKMNKKHTFSNALQFIKFSFEYNIKLLGANIIIGVPNEKEEDIHESIENIYYLRFFLKKRNFELMYSNLLLEKESYYYKNLPLKEKKSYYFHPIDFLYLDKKGIRLNELIGYKSNIKDNYLWDKLIKINNYYMNKMFSYEIFKEEDCYVYNEYVDKVLCKNLILDDDYYNILKLANDQVVTLDKICNGFENMNKLKIKTMLRKLSEEGLIYYNKDYSEIISIINTDVI